jgi:hypothetical protein
MYCSDREEAAMGVQKVRSAMQEVGMGQPQVSDPMRARRAERGEEGITCGQRRGQVADGLFIGIVPLLAVQGPGARGNAVTHLADIPVHTQATAHT